MNEGRLGGRSSSIFNTRNISNTRNGLKKTFYY